ncbi:MAG: polyprenyl synthetase family protein [Ruminococcaceae bacterium]|nr:polyprenyl synthetase family protein [Oscillospiraceae bacterium]
MDFKTEFNNKVNTVNTYLEKYLENKTDVPATILESMRYSLFAGGKRIRPVLMMASYELFEDNTDVVMPFACALEMIHTYSLIHDDLPAMDNSDLRRGRKTNHIVFGEAIAVLAGDALLNYAFETMLSSAVANSEKTIRAAAYMATCSGIGGMIGGQVIDILSENKVIDETTMQELHTKKTGALIRSGAICGAICAGADEGKIKLLEEYALNLGLAFQIKDDILDVEGDVSKLGKPTGGDTELCKNTYVSLYGIDRAKEMLEESTNKAKALLGEFGKKASFLIDFTDYLLKRDN